MFLDNICLVSVIDTINNLVRWIIVTELSLNIAKCGLDTYIFIDASFVNLIGNVLYSLSLLGQ